MPHRSRSPESKQSNVPTVDATRLRATGTGTEGFRRRFEPHVVDDFFRTAAGLTISSIGIGTYLGDSTDEHDRAYESAIQTAVSQGVNLIDTAINYRSQRSERSVGAAIQQLIATGNTTREELVVCTKGGYIPLDGTPPASRDAYRDYVRREFIDTQILHPDEIVAGGHCLAPRFLRYCIAKSRQNLGLRTIDVYYLHNPGQQLGSVDYDELLRRVRGAFEVCEAAVERGEITVYGCATWESLRVPPGGRDHVALADLVRLARELAGDAHHFKVVQSPINLAMTEAVKTPTQPVNGRLLTLAEAATELGLSLVGSASLMQARLASGLPSALASHFPDCTTDAQRAIAFARSVPGVTAVLAGMKQSAHVTENLGCIRRN